jgi:fructokinase
MPDIITIGESLIDFLSIEKGVLIEDSRGFTIAPGGAPANVAAAVAKLGGKSGFMGKVGKDSFGVMIRKTLQDSGVDVDHLLMDDTVNTTLAFISVKQDGEPDFLFYRNRCGADLAMRRDEIRYDYMTEASILHFGSINFTREPLRSATIDAVEWARSRGILISFDPNLRPSLWESMTLAKSEIQRGLGYADIVKLTDVELQFITGNNSLQKGTMSILEYGPRMVLVTRGKDSCFFRNEEMFFEFPTFSVQLVDSTGAGDSFMGGTLLRLFERKRSEDAVFTLPRDEMEAILRFATACGALTVTRKGVIPALPTMKEVETFLDKQ